MSRQLVVAYLDAGTGSMVLQLLAGGIVGILAFVKFRWQSVKGWLQRNGKQES
jgi:hypothetical protein